VARHALANGFDVRHFQLGNLANQLPDRRVIITIAMAGAMLLFTFHWRTLLASSAAIAGIPGKSRMGRSNKSVVLPGFKTANSRAKMSNVATKMASTNH